MLINNKLYKLGSDGSYVEYTTDDLPEGSTNKYSKGGIQNIVALTPYEPLNNVTAYAVSDGDKAFAVTTGSYNAYVVADGDRVYEVSSGLYTAYEAVKPAVYKNYYEATAIYNVYQVEDENNNVYYTAIEGQLDEEVVDQQLYSDDELINEVTVTDTCKYNELQAVTTRHGLVLEDFDTTHEVFTDTNDTPFDFTGYIEPEMFVKSSTIADRILISPEVRGYKGTQVAGDTVYSDNKLRIELTGENPNDFILTGNAEPSEQIAWAKSNSGYDTLYTTFECTTEYEVKGYIQLDDFSWTSNTKYGHRAYTPLNNIINGLYSDVLMTVAYNQGDIADYEFTGEVEVASGQNAWTSTSGTQGSYLTNQVMYTDKYLRTVFNPQGAKTTQSFYYTGVTAMGHTGYVKSDVLPIPQQTIYTSTMLLEEMSDGDKSDFSLTGLSYRSERSLNLSDGDCYVNSNTSKMYKWNGSWVFVNDIEDTMLYIQDCAYSVKDNKLEPVVSSARRVIKNMEISTPTTLKVIDARAVYKLQVIGDVAISFDDTNAPEGYELDIVLDLSTGLTQFMTNVRWLQSLNLQQGKYYLRIHDFGYNQPIGEVRGYWA